MSDDPRKKPTLSEISHLFLSSVRDRQAGASPPLRTPPPRTDGTIDLTPAEFAQVYGAPGDAGESRRKAVPVCAVVAAHFNGKQFDRVKQYARHLASRVGRVGLIELDSSELRLMCFEPVPPASPGETDANAPECSDPRLMAEAIEELNCDVEQWLLLLPNPRTPEAKALLRQVGHWVVLSTCDHDGIVSSYRMLKGLAEGDPSRPALSLALLDAADDAQAGRVFQKLAGVCSQFLGWEPEAQPAVQPAPGVSEHLVLLSRPARDKAQVAAAPQWTVVSEFLTTAKAAEAARATSHDESSPTSSRDHSPQVADAAVQADRTDLRSDAVADMPVETDVVIPMPRPAPVMTIPPSSQDAFEDVIDLPGQDVSMNAILSAVLQRPSAGLVECPLRPPMCIEARLAVGRDRALVLLAVAGQGLSDLRSIGRAWRWLNENRELIGMALPQFAIEAHRPPQLRLLVDRADLTADVLQPMLESQHISVQAYRKLRWGQKLGVFLEAA